MPKRRGKKKESNKKVLWKKKAKSLSYLQKCIKNSGRPYFNIMQHSFYKKDFLRTNISLFPNNVFCRIEHNRHHKLVCQASAGTYKVKISKKSLKYASKIIINNFFRQLKKKKVSFLLKPIAIVLVSPSNLRKRILLSILRLLKYVKNKRIMVELKAKKIFNGCRAKKQIRKKQKRNAIYK